MTLNFDPLISKCKGKFLSPSCIYVWKLYVENYSSHCVRPQVLTKFRCDLDFLTPKCIGISSHHPASMYEILKLYVENYSSNRVRTKVLIKFCCDLYLWIPKCISIFLSPSCIYVCNMKAVRWKLLKLSSQNQSVDKVLLWPWPLDPKYIFLSPSWSIYESHMLKTTQVIVSEPKCWQNSFVTLTFWL